MKNNRTKIILGISIVTIGLSAYYFSTRKRPTLPKTKSGKLTDEQKRDFLKKIFPSARTIGTKIGVPPLFILAQLALESKYGLSTLTSKYNNFGGIKAVGNQPSVSMLTTECKNNVCKKVYQNFATYPSVYDGLMAQSKIYTNKYFKQHLNKTKDPITYAKLMQSGKIRYATALNYPEAIQSTLNEIKRLKIA